MAVVKSLSLLVATCRDGSWLSWVDNNAAPLPLGAGYPQQAALASDTVLFR
jgi:hypothetical protein